MLNCGTATSGLRRRPRSHTLHTCFAMLNLLWWTVFHCISLRRCEQLPWHLSMCYKWLALKNTLSDLRTFELMWQSTQLRRELTTYWTLLTEGKLTVACDIHIGKVEETVTTHVVSFVELGNQGPRYPPVPPFMHEHASIHISLTC